MGEIARRQALRAIAVGASGVGALALGGRALASAAWRPGTGDTGSGLAKSAHLTGRLVYPPGGASFFHRDALFYAEPGAGWNDPGQTGAVEVWLAQFRQAMRPFVRGAYVNVPDAALQDWGTDYYGTNYERLRRVKRRYDPAEVFSFAQSIPPA